MIQLYCLGKTKQSYVREGVDEFAKRLGRYGRFQWTELKEPKNASRLSPDALKKAEMALILQHLDGQPYFLLDEHGKRMDSVGFAQFLERRMMDLRGPVNFVIGGAYGFHDDLKESAAGLIRLSDMTFSHQLIRLIFAEQLYRAFTIIRNEPYHNV